MTKTVIIEMVGAENSYRSANGRVYPARAIEKAIAEVNDKPFEERTASIPESEIVPVNGNVGVDDDDGLPRDTLSNPKAEGKQDYGSVVRNNLMYQQGYMPYCGLQSRCFFDWPRATFDGQQFKCRCGWKSQYEPEFIAEYKAKWGK